MKKYYSKPKIDILSSYKIRNLVGFVTTQYDDDSGNNTATIYGEFWRGSSLDIKKDIKIVSMDPKDIKSKKLI